ncbi:MAG: Phage uncharacterized protein (Phage XkdX) [Oscillospiraceae bacterium]|nr:Phage uncharacterized protein (Phage XkdX) [Oscillospiraceae bacterium]
MTTKAKALQTLYKRGKVAASGLQQAVSDGMITADEYAEITGTALEEATA